MPEACFLLTSYETWSSPIALETPNFHLAMMVALDGAADALTDVPVLPPDEEKGCGASLCFSVVFEERITGCWPNRITRRERAGR